jgi:tetratricopeptide (TPR) repeat protein
MVFDLRGRRKRVIQVAYAALAIVMALSLFTVVGPVNLGDLFGGSSSSSGSNPFDSQIQRLERQLRKAPKDQKLLAELTRAGFNAGNAAIPRDASGNPTGLTQEAVNDFNKAGDAWQRYLKTKPGKPDTSTAQLAAQALLYSAAASSGIDFEPTVKAAAQAQAIYAAAKPSLNAYITLAQFQYLAGDFAAATQSGSKAVQAAPKSSQPAVKQALAQYKAQGQQIQKQVKAATKFNPNGSGKQALQNPLGNLSGGGSGLSSGLGSQTP